MFKRLFLAGCLIITAFSCKKSALAPAQRALAIYAQKLPNSVEQFSPIYKGDGHCAFTDLIKWQGNYYLTFRNSNSHINGSDGKIIVMKSVDGNKWDVFNQYTWEGYDLRDPKFLISAAGNLLINTEAFTHETPKKRVQVVYALFNTRLSAEPISDIDDNPGEVIKTPVGDWPWRFSKYKENYYAWAYTANPKDFKLIKTDDFKTYSTVVAAGNLNTPTEATIRFANDSVYSVVRSNANALLGRASSNNLSNIKWDELPMVSFGGPDFVFYNSHQILLCGREQLSNTAYTSLYLYDLTQSKVIYKMRLPSGGDTSYPGLYLDGNQLWISYYSSHIEGKAQVYLVKVNLDKFFMPENAFTNP